MQQIIDRLKCGPKTNSWFQSVIFRLRSVSSSSSSHLYRSTHREAVDPRVIERLTLESRRLRRLNEAEQDYTVPEKTVYPEVSLHKVIKRLSSRKIPDEVDLLLAQTFELPRSKVVSEEIPDDSDLDYEAMRMETIVHNEWCNKFHT